MSYIAGMLLLVMGRFEAFVCLSNLITNWILKPFFKSDEFNMNHRLQLFKQIFFCNMPDLCEHFEMEKVIPQHYLIEWIMTLFVKSLDLSIASHIWDLIMLDGGIMILKVSAALLKLIHKELQNGNMDKIITSIKKISTFIKDEKEFVKIIYSIQIPDWVAEEIIRTIKNYSQV